MTNVRVIESGGNVIHSYFAKSGIPCIGAVVDFFHCGTYKVTEQEWIDHDKVVLTVRNLDE